MPARFSVSVVHVQPIRQAIARFDGGASLSQVAFERPLKLIPSVTLTQGPVDGAGQVVMPDGIGPTAVNGFEALQKDGLSNPHICLPRV